jgi:hypothetical protein
MAPNRPFARLGIGDLEEIFEKQGSDLTVLARLKHELSHRQVPRALALQEKVKKIELGQLKDAEATAGVLNRAIATKLPTTSSTNTQQFDLLSAAPKIDDRPIEVQTRASDVSTTFEPQSLPQLALEDACALLKVSAGDSWDKVEMARRRLVQKSSPTLTKNMASGQIEKFLAEARLANDAAIVIAARRSGRN